MKVKLVRQHPLKVPSFFEKNKGTVFDIIQKREGGYDVDMAPLGKPGELGWMYCSEVEEILDVHHDDIRALFRAMHAVGTATLTTALNAAEAAKKMDPAAGIFVAKLDQPPVIVGGQAYSIYGARVLCRTATGTQPFVTPHLHALGVEPYVFKDGVGEMNFGHVLTTTTEFRGIVVATTKSVIWDTPVMVRRGEEFLIEAGQVHSFRNLGTTPADFLFACPDSHLVDHDDEHPQGDRYIVRGFQNGTPSHFR
ncbi:MAG: hypothetical protein HY457_02745 [Parcubacteria group bacterium]|nr:hypothetical protein [Parcubacteria group bacterium]